MATAVSRPTFKCSHVPRFTKDELILKAKEELNEDPENRDKKIEEFRSLIQADDTLLCDTDDDVFLLRFLRCRKFDMERAFECLTSYCKAKKRYEKYLNNCQNMPRLLSKNIFGVLDNVASDGSTIYIFRYEFWNPSDFTMDDILPMVLWSGEDLFNHNEDTQICGIQIILDHKGFNQWRHGRQMIPWLYDAFFILQNCVTARVKALHFLNQPKIIDMLVPVFRPFLSEKLLSRVHFHGSNYASLHKHLSPDILPADFQGNLPKFNYDTRPE